MTARTIKYWYPMCINRDIFRDKGILDFMVREDSLDSEEKVSILKPKFVTIKLNYNVHKNGDLKLRFTLYKISI